MSDSVYLLLTAEEQNWGIKVPGDWKSKKWSIFSDGTYETVTAYVPGRSRGFYEQPAFLRRLYKDSAGSGQCTSDFKKTGQLEITAFQNLLVLLGLESWGPHADLDAHDGTGWKIESYREDGTIDKTSGTGYIYGNTILESIAKILNSI